MVRLEGDRGRGEVDLKERELTNLGRGAFVSRPSTGCIELKVLIEKEIERERENKK